MCLNDAMMRWSFIVTARIETLLGGAHWKSKKMRRFFAVVCVNRSPVSGFRLSHNLRKVSRVTTSPGFNPSRSQPTPIHCPACVSL